LSKKEISQIVEIQLKDVQNRLIDKHSSSDFQQVKDYIVDQGFDPVLGARPLRKLFRD
jgi:ATP-dependent Clp protease ATP-binding subunit ClpA